MTAGVTSGRVVFKYPLALRGPTIVADVQQPKVCHFGLDPDSQLCAWIEHCPDHRSSPTGGLKLTVVGTGHREIPVWAKHAASAVLARQGLVLHLYVEEWWTR